MDSIDEVLAHYGVKGMRWGKRGAKDTSPSDVEVKVEGKKIKTTGGKNQAPVKEAVDVAVARQKAKASSVRSLSNNELQAAVKRMQLEVQFSELNAKTNPSKVAKGQKVVKELLGLGNTANQVVGFNNSPAGQELRKKLKEANNP